MSASSSEDENDVPQELLDAAEDAVQSTLPSKSKKLYLKTYEDFLDWRTEHKTNSFKEVVLLAYFSELSKKVCPSTLWSKYSMVKAMICVKDEIDIGKYKKLGAFLKNKNVGFTSKKSKAFTSEDIKRYLADAPDEVHLDRKVIHIIGITGACRREELHQLTVDNVKDEETHLTVTLPNTKTHITRKLAINNPFRDIVMQYLALRPNSVRYNNFFLNYQNGKCTSQVIGVNKIGKTPSLIAKWLGLPQPECYTGHALRRTSATLLADAGASMTVLERHGGWKSAQVAEGYIQDSIANKRKICDQITDAIINEASCDSTASKVLKKLRVNDGEEDATSSESTSDKTNINIQLDKCSIQ